LPSQDVEPLIKKAFNPEAISSGKIDALRKKIAQFDQAIQAAKDTSAKYWEVLVEKY
jgi:hypothetical protein